nr:MAG TPA: hypothetical protein [Caudoviricetes sp.]
MISVSMLFQLECTPKDTKKGRDERRNKVKC